ncbi:MAG: FG-GAP repeat protein [Sandaracinaceae bacterium]|nr:FG-GAP repeat protein [Sandaracinaceae bacterium]MDW8245481.1 FG-GAP repeat protein [Sandaracinaceae bacterium]
MRRSVWLDFSGVLPLASLGFAFFLSACYYWDDFTRLRNQAQVTLFRSESEIGPRFGQIMVGYEVPIKTQSGAWLRGTRLLVAGSSLPGEARATYASFRVWQELMPQANTVEYVLEPDRGNRNFNPPFMFGCHVDDHHIDTRINNCGVGRRAVAVAPYIQHPGGMNEDWWGCVAVTSGPYQSQERLQIRCESLGVNTTFHMNLENGLGWGASAAGIPIFHQFGIGVFGAPLTDGKGAVFRLPHLREAALGSALGAMDGGSRVGIITFDGLSLEEGDEFGRNLALSVDRTSLTMGQPTLRLAVAFGKTTRRVAVAQIVSWSGAGAQAQVVACLGGEEGFGDAMVFGDFNGDGKDDLAIGSQPTKTGGQVTNLPVAIYDGTTWQRGDRVECGTSRPPSLAPSAMIQCKDSTTPVEASCRASRFGFSLAAGDFNGDGKADLAIGAPGANTRYGTMAGMVQVVAGNESLAMMDQGDRSVLWLATNKDNAGFGFGVAAVPAPLGRAEIAVSQVAPPDVYIFYCSGLKGDREDEISVPTGAERVRGCALRPPRGSSMLNQGLLPPTP